MWFPIVQYITSILLWAQLIIASVSLLGFWTMTQSSKPFFTTTWIVWNPDFQEDSTTYSWSCYFYCSKSWVSCASFWECKIANIDDQVIMFSQNLCKSTGTPRGSVISLTSTCFWKGYRIPQNRFERSRRIWGSLIKSRTCQETSQQRHNSKRKLLMIIIALPCPAALSRLLPT